MPVLPFATQDIDKLSHKVALHAQFKECRAYHIKDGSQQRLITNRTQKQRYFKEKCFDG